MVRTVFRWIAAVVVLGVIGGAVLLFLRRGASRQLPKPEACPVVSNVIETITHVFAPGGDVIRLDVRKLSCADFERRLRGVSDAATLWTPGEGDWLIVGAEGGSSNTLSRVLEAFADESTVFSFPEVFANCAGTVGDIREAFAGLNPEDGVVPELFVAKEIPSFAWLSDGTVEPDIARRTRQEMRSMQVVRRVVLEGNMLSRAQRENEAIEKWTNAYRRSPNDTLLLERMDHLFRNAEVFFRVGKYGTACKCYETLIRIRPDDFAAMANLAECLKRLGKRELSEAVTRKAETLCKPEPVPPANK